MSGGGRKEAFFSARFLWTCLLAVNRRDKHDATSG